MESKQIITLEKVDKIMATIDDVLAGVTELDTLEDSLIALTTNIKALLDAALANTTVPAEVQAKIDAVFAQVEANKVQVADAVTANTPQV
jgi:hypothetical protein